MRRHLLLLPLLLVCLWHSPAPAVCFPGAAWLSSLLPSWPRAGLVRRPRPPPPSDVLLSNLSQTLRASLPHLPPSLGGDGELTPSVFSAPRLRKTNLLPRLLKAPSSKAAGSRLSEQVDDDFSTDKALMFAKLASIAYCSTELADIQNWTCTRCVEVPGFQVHTVVFDRVWDLLAYVGYHKGLNAIVVSFRGTDSSNSGQWVENLRAFRLNKLYPVPGYPKAMVHYGFAMLWSQSSMQADITAAVGELLVAHPGVWMYTTGHSMGAALAQLAALDIKFHYDIDSVGCYTFGTPRVGNFEYAKLFQVRCAASLPGAGHPGSGCGWPLFSCVVRPVSHLHSVTCAAPAAPSPTPPQG